MNELALFAGAGGGILGGHLLGWRTVCAVEWEPYPASVLCARQNDGLLPTFPIWDNVQTFDGKPWRGIAQVVSGGFPCQDISAAGKGVGITGKRSGMWGEMARIIGEVQPQYAFVENSPMLTSRGLGTVLGDLSEMGFDAKWCVLGADFVGAPHKRDRIWILATNARGIGCNIWGSNWKERSVLHDINWNASESESKRERWIGGIGQIGSDVANTNSYGFNNKKQGKLGKSAIQTETREKFNQIGRYSILANTTQLYSDGGNDNSRIIMEQETQPQLGDNSGTEALANTRCESERTNKKLRSESKVSIGQDAPIICGEISDPTSIRQSGQGQHEQPVSSEESSNWQTSYVESIGRPEFWAVEPNVGRVANGVAARVDRLKAIGNGQVPLCAATAWRILSE